jgi:hypothetical protein
MSQVIDSPTPSVAEEVSPAPEGNSSEAVGVGEQQQAETSGQVVEQGTATADAAQVAQPDPAQAQEVFEDDQPLPESVGPKALREYGDRWKAKATGFEQALTPLGGLEGLQELAEPLQALLNPASDGVSVMEAVSRIAPHIDAHEFVSSALDAMPDEQAARVLSERADDAVKILFGDILGQDVTAQSIRDILDLYKPDIDPALMAERDALRHEREEFQTERNAAKTERERAAQAETSRQVQEAAQSISKEIWQVPVEHVIGKLKFRELPSDAPESVKKDFERGELAVKMLVDLAAKTDPQVSALNVAEQTLVQAFREGLSPQQREQLRNRALNHGRGFGQNVVKAKALEWGTFIKGLLDDRLALRASEAHRATDQRAEVASAGGGGVVSSSARGPMPPYGTPAYEKWLTEGFNPQPAPRQ